MMAQHVRDIMTAAPVTVEPQTPVATVAQVMRDQNIGAVLVTEGDRLRGLVSDRTWWCAPSRRERTRGRPRWIARAAAT
jgi:predicted transcriptional regulator